MLCCYYCTVSPLSFSPPSPPRSGNSGTSCIANGNPGHAADGSPASAVFTLSHLLVRVHEEEVRLLRAHPGPPLLRVVEGQGQQRRVHVTDHLGEPGLEEEEREGGALTQLTHKRIIVPNNCGQQSFLFSLVWGKGVGCTKPY